MLIKCPECKLQVSDKALSCPHCGYPLSNQKPKTKYNKKKRRLPNGFGQISEIKGRNLRNPFRAMVTVGKTDYGRPICKPLKPESYFATYNDAYLALVEYNKNPYDLSPAITVKELYERWSEEYFKKASASSIKSVKAVWGYCSSVYSMRVVDLRQRHIKTCMENGTIMYKGNIKKPEPWAQVKMKSMFNLMLDYAVEYEIVDRNYSRNFKLTSDLSSKKLTQKDHFPFTEQEMSILWQQVNDIPNIDMILIQCYSGWRPTELCLLKLEDVNITDWTFKGGIKTEAGTNRVVPIHPRIRPLIIKRYKEAKDLGSKYLFNEGKPFSYNRYMARFTAIRDSLGLDSRHRPHDGRKHFVTMAKKYNVDEYAIKYIVGHAINDITESVYTQRDLAWLSTEMQKIK